MVEKEKHKQIKKLGGIVSGPYAWFYFDEPAMTIDDEFLTLPKAIHI